MDAAEYRAWFEGLGRKYVDDVERLNRKYNITLHILDLPISPVDIPGLIEHQTVIANHISEKWQLTTEHARELMRLCLAMLEALENK